MRFRWNQPKPREGQQLADISIYQDSMEDCEKDYNALRFTVDESKYDPDDSDAERDKTMSYATEKESDHDMNMSGRSISFRKEQIYRACYNQTTQSTTYDF